jgi:hypothetical protein
LSVTCDRSVVFSKSSGLLQQQNWQSRYNWNIVESGAKHHQTNKQTKQIPFLWNFSCIGVFCPWYNIMLYPMCKDCFSFQIYHIRLTTKHDTLNKNKMMNTGSI